MINLTLRLNAAPFMDALADTVILAQRSFEVRQGLVDALEAFEQFATIQCDLGPAGTGEATVRLDPSDRLLSLSTAFRAGNANLGVLEHQKLSSGGLNDAIGERVVGGVESPDDSPLRAVDGADAPP